ncbi:hypothetical protein J3F84DRAFT_356532 [Trichoderma pleuroticola]
MAAALHFLTGSLLYFSFVPSSIRGGSVGVSLRLQSFKCCSVLFPNSWKQHGFLASVRAIRDVGSEEVDMYKVRVGVAPGRLFVTGDRTGNDRT